MAARYDRPPGTAQPDLETLTFSGGEPGYTLDVDASMELIDLVLHDPVNRYVDLPVEAESATDNGLNALRDMIVAYLDSEGFMAVRYSGSGGLSLTFSPIRSLVAMSGGSS